MWQVCVINNVGHVKLITSKLTEVCARNMHTASTLCFYSILYTFLFSSFQVNCAQQLENVASYSFMKEKLAKNQVHLHAFWFCLDTASVYMLCKKTEQFVEVDEDNYTQLASEAEQYF